MFKRLLLLLFIAISFSGRSQCPQVFNYLGNLSPNPYWISCTGNSSYTLNFQSNTSWGTYTIMWGDGAPNFTAAAYTASTVINHTYTSVTPDTFVVTLLVPSLSCTLTGVVVMEQAVVAAIQLPPGGTNTACAPAVLSFSNSSSNVSPTTKFKWNFGDNSPQPQLTYTNGGTTVAHTYSVGSVNCQTAVTLSAWNYCSMGTTAIATYSPIQIFSKDAASATVNKFFSCWPDNAFTFTNTTTGNCAAQGNTFQRKEWWNFGNYWAAGDSIYNWSNWPPVTPRTIAYPAPGTYTAMLRDSSFCGVDTAIITVNLLNQPTAGVVAPAGLLCQNTPVTFTNTSAPGYFYLWNFGTGAGFVNLGAGNKTFTYTSPGTYTVQVAAFLPGGGAACTGTASTVINILPAPTPSIVFNPPFGCSNASVTFTDVSAGTVAWSWDLGNGNTSTLQTTPAQNYTTIGSYVITLTVTGANSCINTGSTSLVVHPNPVANFNPTITCASAITNFTNTSIVSGTNAITNYTWNFGDGSPDDFTQNPAHTFTSAATFSVQLTVATAFCSGSVTKTVVVNVKPAPDFAFTPTAACSPFNVTFTNTSTNGNTYLWNFGTVPTATSNATNPSFTYTNGLAADQTFTTTLYVTSNAGCTDSIKKTVTVFPVPLNSFSVNIAQGCSPLAVSFTNNTSGATTYSWNFGDGLSSTSTNPSHTYTNAGATAQVNTVQLITTSSLNCSSSTTQTISVFPKPGFTFSMVPSSGCTPLSVSFPSVAGASSYTWNFGDGSPGSNASNPIHVFTNTLLTNQTYTVELIAANAFGCLDTTNNFPVIFPGPVADFSAAPGSGCHPLPVTFTNTSQANNSNNWDFDNGQTSTAVHPMITFTQSPGSSATTFSVKLLVTSTNNCKDSIIKTVNLLARPQASFSLDTPACSPKIMNFTNNSNGATTYTWDYGDGEISTQTSPTHSFVNTGNSNLTFTVSLIAVNADNCADTSRVTFVVHPEAVFNIVASPDSGCSPLNVIFSSLSGATQYQWTFGDGSSSSTAGASHSFLNTDTVKQTFTTQLVAADQYGCKDTTYKTFKVFPKPVALFIADPLHVTIPLHSASFTNQSTGANTYLWLFGDGATSTQNSPIHSYTLPGEYQVTLIANSTKGCKDTFNLAQKIVAVEQTEVQIPNAFTPNKNGSPGTIFDPKDTSNDIFHPNIKGVDKYSMSIYSRWGELLFETQNPGEGWDGYYKGKLCTEDVYIWKISATFFDGQKFDKSGDLFLVR